MLYLFQFLFNVQASGKMEILRILYVCTLLDIVQYRNKLPTPTTGYGNEYMYTLHTQPLNSNIQHSIVSVYPNKRQARYT